MLPHRDDIAIKKIIREMNIGVEMLGNMKLDVFLEDE